MEYIEKLTLVKYFNEQEIAFINRAYEFAKQVHAQHVRKSGEPYITHPVEVAYILLEELGPSLGISITAAAVAAALLHDVVEDGDVTMDEIGALFWEDRMFAEQVIRYVDILTKKDIEHYFRLHHKFINKLLILPILKSKYKKLLKNALKPDQLGEYYMNIAEELMTVLIKYADKIHNHRTAQQIARTKRLERVFET